MATKFGRIEHSGNLFEEQTFYKNQTLTSASVGVGHHFGLKDDRTDKNDSTLGVLTTSGSYWAWSHIMFYMSGSSKVNTDEQQKFNSIYHNLNEYNDLKPFHKNKFYDTASIFYIPQQKMGERIKPGTFQLTARTGSSTNTTKQIIIKDDSNGNLYSSNAYHSQSSNSSLSSSANYIGNLYYDLGIAILTETGSWSGSNGIRYTDINSKVSHVERDYRYWKMKFQSTTPIFTSQYTIKIPAGEFNHTLNSTARIQVSGSLPDGFNQPEYANLKTDLTGSGWSPYFTQIQLYGKQDDEPILVGSLPRPIKMRDDVDLIITFRIDH